MKLENPNPNPNPNNMTSRWQRDNVEHAHLRIDILEDGKIKTDGRVKSTEENVEILLKTLVATEIRKDSNKTWFKWVAIGAFSIYIISQIGLIEAVKIWLGMV